MIRTIEHHKIKPAPVSEENRHGVKWLHIENPTREDVVYLKDNFKFHELDLEDLVSHQQRPKIDPYPNYVFLVFHFPVLEKGRIYIREVDFFIGSDYVITSVQEPFEPLNALFEKCSADKRLKEKLFSADSKMLFYRILDNFVELLLPLVDKISAELDEIDKMVLEKQSSNGTIDKITLLRRNLVVLQTLIRPEISIMIELEGGGIVFFGSRLTEYWSDILDHLRKVSDQLENCRYLLEGLALAHESLVSYKINETIKIWTILAGLLLPPTLLASLYGMNIPLPFQGESWAIVFVSGLMILNIIGMLFYFRRKNWL